MPKWNERNRMEPIPPKLGTRDTPPIAPETPRTVPEGKPAKELVVDDHATKLHYTRAEPAASNGFGLRRTASLVEAALEIAYGVNAHPIESPVSQIERPSQDRANPGEAFQRWLDTAHEANKESVEVTKKRLEAEQEIKKSTKEATDKMHKGEIRETPPTKPPEKPAEKATSEVSKAQAEKQRVLAPDAKVVRSTVEPPRPVHRAPGIKEVDFSPKPQETKKEGTGKDGKEDPTKHKFETPDQPKPKPTIQGPKM